MREGKTTFAINLATSIAWSGKSVLLIDGDLRKPDIAPLLNIPVEARGLQDVMTGRVRRAAVYSVPSSRLDVLAPNPESPGDVFEMISSPRAAQRIEAISQKYDHVIIDTPPVLAFTDALVWAKMAGAVVLTTFAGQTKAPELKEAKKRLTEIGVKILGTVLGNVDPDHGYFRYARGYYSRSGRSSRRARRRMLLAAY
jgi:tyrosine-protein kinase Etk/Wzc